MPLASRTCHCRRRRRLSAPRLGKLDIGKRSGGGGGVWQGRGEEGGLAGASPRGLLPSKGSVVRAVARRCRGVSPRVNHQSVCGWRRRTVDGILQDERAEVEITATTMPEALLTRRTSDR